jgi:NAD(P)-dependent dehydrogenase (short-subunit alcohol dehydrogenase family)
LSETKFSNKGKKMKLNFSGKIALVTGSSEGIGLASAELLLEEGAQVIINGRTDTKLQMIAAQLRKKFPQGSLKTIAADLGTSQGTQALIQEVPFCDILINNLGFYELKSFEQISDEDWMHIWEVNVMSGVRLSRYYLSQMLKKGWGRLIFITSESALQIPKEMIHYGVTKTAQIALARGLAELTKGTNVTSNSIIVGPTLTEGVQDFVKDIAQKKNLSIEQVKEQFFQDMRPTSLLKRFIEPKEIANLIVYIASEASSATNGAALRADGGVVESII